MSVCPPIELPEAVAVGTPVRPIIVFDLAETLIAGLQGIEHHIARVENQDPQKLGAIVGSTRLWDLFRGHCSVEEYFTGIAQQGNWRTFSYEEFDAWVHKAFLHAIDGMPELVMALSSRCDLYILTDHHRAWVDYIVEHHPFLKCFQKIYISQEIGAVKRDGRPFEILQLQLNSRQTRRLAFVDDSLHNVEIASRYGFDAFHFTGAASLETSLEEWMDGCRQVN